MQSAKIEAQKIVEIPDKWKKCVISNANYSNPTDPEYFAIMAHADVKKLEDGSIELTNKSNGLLPCLIFQKIIFELQYYNAEVKIVFT